MIKRSTSKFLSEYAFKSNAHKDETARVIVEVDYKDKRYSISPYCGSTDGKFQFKGLGGKHVDVNKWKAIVRAIDAAIEFAEKELKEELELY